MALQRPCVCHGLRKAATSVSSGIHDIALAEMPNFAPIWRATAGLIYEQPIPSLCGLHLRAVVAFLALHSCRTKSSGEITVTLQVHADHAGLQYTQVY
jgi:hypothetical protein